MTDKTGTTPPVNDAPDMQEIGDKLKELGKLVSDAIEKAHNSDQVKKINEDVAAAVKDVSAQVKSGEFSKRAKTEIRDALTFVNNKLDEYLKDDEKK
jgi:hypothetical protein